MKIRGHEFEKEKGRVYRRVWREETEGGNDVYQNKQTNKNLGPFKDTLRTNSD